MPVSQRSTIKGDIPQEIQTGEMLQVGAIPLTNLFEAYILHTDPIPAFSTIVFNIYPPVDMVAKLHQMTLFASSFPAGPVGTHDFYLLQGTYTVYLYGSSNDTTDIDFSSCHWYSADDVALPPDVVAQQIALRSVIFTNSLNLDVVYDNFTNRPQSNPIEIDLIMEVTGEWV